MQVATLFWTEAAGWGDPAKTVAHANLVLYFGSRQVLASEGPYRELKDRFPQAHMVGCSTGGQIVADDISDDTIAAVALRFERTGLCLAAESLSNREDSRFYGEKIGQKLKGDGLSGIFVLSDGLNVNGSELVAGITAVVGAQVPISGGLAGDGVQFQETLVGTDCLPRSRLAAAIGFYGPYTRIGHGSAGGWNVFGPRRLVTRSAGTVLYELDGEPALNLYERYLGEEAKGLPGTGLLFPLQIFDPNRPDHMIVRTILATDTTARSMTFAGDVPQGWVAQLMRGNFERLAAGSGDAARQAYQGVRDVKGNGVAILVSCIGRRLLMGQHIVDEIEAASAELDAGMSRLGFYSYGEISPHAASGCCELQNQTMSVTTIREAA